MKLHTDKKLYIEFSDFLSAGWKEDTLKKANLRNGSNWQMVKNPTDQRKPMVAYDSLIDAHKEKIQAWLRKINGCTHDSTTRCECGNPYEYVAKEPIRKMVQKDFKAEAFFVQYKYIGTSGDSKGLPDKNTIEKYTTEASYLNMLVTVQANIKELVKQALNLTVDSFYKHVADILNAEIEQGNITSKFPTSYRRLSPKIDEYKKGGYATLIHKSFGNSSAAKICDEVSESLIISMISHENQYDDVYVAHQYNRWASTNGYKTIDPATVGVWRRKKDGYVKSNREGREPFNNSIRRKVIRQRPTQPTYLWESDDNHLDWWFRGDKANEYRKIKGIMVTDSFNDYVLGWAMTAGEMPGEIVKLSYLNAIYHVHELVNDGNWYLPHEVKTDQWNIKQLRPFYQNIAHYYDTPVGSKNRGWLENFFGHKDWERSLKIGNNNYTGHNITAKKRGVNMEAVKANKVNWPHISEAGTKMEEAVQRLRLMPRNYDEQNKSRQQEWLEAWNAMPADKKITISEEQMLLKFGFRHKWENRITDQGIRPTIAGKTYNYSVPPEYYLQNNGKKIEIIYDPYNMNRVLVTDNEGLRFIANSVTKVAGCMADMQDGGRTFLNKILEEAKADTTLVTNAAAKRQAVLLENRIDADTILRLGASVPKEIKHYAEEVYQLPESSNQPLLPEEDIEEFDLYKMISDR
ncbi:MAG: hypothetical protein Q8K66_04120 [Sediminibacterium sp.]|nr:hypothetical protein [Sediminibacterium sp.]MDP3128125.1 hypothetical protein [Sediminibacterium sp.]